MRCRRDLSRTSGLGARATTESRREMMMRPTGTSAVQSQAGRRRYNGMPTRTLRCFQGELSAVQYVGGTDVTGPDPSRASWTRCKSSCRQGGGVPKAERSSRNVEIEREGHLGTIAVPTPVSNPCILGVLWGTTAPNWRCLPGKGIRGFVRVNRLQAQVLPRVPPRHTMRNRVNTRPGVVGGAGIEPAT